MTIKILKHIILSVLPGLSMLLVAGCTDEYFGPEENNTGNNPDVISFSATAGGSSARTRSTADKPLYEPLELTDEAASSTLYLHTYDSERIGFQPGDEDEESDSYENSGAQTRGNQIKNADDLIKFHKDFYVHAEYKDSREEYIEWCQTQVSSANNIWRTAKTRYWPGDRMLSFHAVSPSSEFTNLKNRQHDADNSLSFSYTARKGASNQDATAQSDLLIAAGSCNKPGSVEGRAPLVFHHALSAVKFAIRDVLDGEVVNIRIAGVRSSGNCRYTATDEGEGSFVWSEQSGEETYSQNFNYAVNGRPAGGIDPSDETQDILLNNEMPEKTFMLIPQEIPDDAEIIVTLKRNNPGKDEDDKQLPETITVRGKIKANNVTEWLPGHEYVYTISTSKDNWVYVFKATGNHNSNNGRHYTSYNASANQIYVYSPSVNEHDTYNDDAFFNVRSYRYRANNPNIIEDLPWTASHGDAKQYRVRTKDVYVEGRDISAAEWITDPADLKGKGSHAPTGEQHNLTFATHHQMTDWPGDKWMQDQTAYSGYSKNKPWDLSTCGGKLSRNTANCYVIDREGWYFFPLVYGNAIKNGADNKDAYVFSGPKQGTLQYNYKYLDVFVNHLGSNISSAKIPESYCKRVSKSWADVYNVISDLEIIKYDNILGVRFRANKFNLQQGSSCIAVFDSNNRVVWSWHIWITEHWLNPQNGQPNAFDSSSAFNFSKADRSGWRNRGDVRITGVGRTNSKYYISPYNLGWCDPKNVDYLKRPGNMDFIQYQKDGITKSGHVASLPILQDGAQIEYKYGNNTYYQFGRKDPMVGFVDHKSNIKRNFGPYQYNLGKQPVDLKEGILHPNTLFCTGDPKDADRDEKGNPTFFKSNDWCNTVYINLWNNSTENDSRFIFNTADFNEKFYFFNKKTIYDPCPPGYMVPPGGVWKIIGTGTGGSYQSQWFSDKDLSKLNGLMNAGDQYTFRIWGGSKEDQNTTLWLTSTGHRWFSNYYDNTNKGGDNFNSQLVYLWSTTPTGRNDFSAFSLALGQHSANGYGVCAFFRGRRSMARPVRAIRESYVDPNKTSHN